MAEIDDAKIRALAYQMWERDGAPHGKDDQYWHAAKKLLADEGNVDDDDVVTPLPIPPVAPLTDKK